MDGIKHLLRLADAYGAAEQVGDSTLSWRVFGDSKKLTSLRAGADITLKRFAAGMQWFSDHWPEGVDWPNGVDRPEPTPPEADAA